MQNEDYLAKIHSDYSHLSGVEKQRIAFEQSKERAVSKELKDAIDAVDTMCKTGNNKYRYDYDKWTAACHLLEKSGDTDRAEKARFYAIRAYRHEEWCADCL